MKKIHLHEISPQELADLISTGIAKQLSEIIPSKVDDDDLLTREQTFKMLNINSVTLWRWTNDDVLQAYKIGGRVYYKRNEIIEVINDLKQKI